MKKILSTILLLVSLATYAQEFNGKAVYKEISSIKERYLQQLKDPEVSQQKKELISESIKVLENMFENSFELIFNENSSMYKIIEKIALKADDEFTMPFSSIYFKDFEKRMYYDKKDNGGNKYVIHDSLPKYDWQLTNETKKIGKYTCYRAFYNDSIMSQKRIENKDGGFETIDVKKDIITEAWYAPEIPLSNGPHRFGGLPGLILEMKLYGGQTTLVCVEVELNMDEKQKIIFPKKKNTISEGERADQVKEAQLRNSK